MIILARVPLRDGPKFGDGDRVSISGLVMADGAARYDAGGLIRVVYLAGSSIAASTRLVLAGPRRQP